YLEKFKRTFIKSEATFENDSLTFLTRVETFVQDAVFLKQCMDKYSKTAGVYAVAILYVSTVNVIRYMNFVITRDTLEFVSNSLMFNASCFVAIGFLSSFGNYLQGKAKTMKEDLVVTHVRSITPQSDQVHKLLLWLSTWDFKLSLLDMFDLNHTTIPAVTAVVLTYFVLLFQLRTSENMAQN
ncbi:unnamed protein product, partial [Allacma fusca]